METTHEREVTRKSVGASIAAVLGNFAGPNVMITPTLGIFALALTTEFGWTRTQFYGVNVLVAWSAAIVAPLTGRAVDRWGARRVLLPGVVLFAVAYACVSLANGTLAQFLALFGAVGVTAGIQAHVGYKKVVSQWFSRHRGMALTLVSAIGVGVGTTVMPQVARVLVDDIGWRHAYQAIGLIILIVGLPIPLFLLREPKADDRAGLGAEAPVRIHQGMTRGQAMRTGAFWLMVGSIVLSNAALVGTSAHIFPMLTDRGVGRELASAVLSMTAMGSIVGQLSSGALLDRIDSPKIAIPFFAVALLGALFLQFSTVPVLFAGGGFLMGMTKGAELGMVGYFCTRYFGLRSFGAIYGVIYGFSTVAAGLGPVLTAMAYDRLGSYSPMFVAFDVFFALSLIGMALLRPYTFTKSGSPLDAAAVVPKPIIG